MSEGETAADQRLSDVHLLYLGMGLTYLVATVHLFHPSHGFARLVTLAAVGQAELLLTDPRPLAFTLAAVLLIVGANLVVANRWRRPLFVLGMVMTATFILGYLAWHFTGHGGFLPGRQPVFHDVGPLENVVNHLTTDLIAAASKVLEVALFVTLWKLYKRENDGGLSA